MYRSAASPTRLNHLPDFFAASVHCFFCGRQVKQREVALSAMSFFGELVKAAVGILILVSMYRGQTADSHVYIYLEVDTVCGAYTSK